MNNIQKFFLSAIGIMALSYLFLANPSLLKAQPSTQTLSGFGWSGISQTGNPGGAGWISFKDTSSILPGYKVEIDSNGDLKGFAWANPHDGNSNTRNFGWIQFGGLSGFPTGPGTTATNARLVGNNIVGWARFCSGTKPVSPNLVGTCDNNLTNSNSGGWDGWISFRGNTSGGGAFTGSYGVSVGLPNAQGQKFLSGFAWGGPSNVGWIDMSQVFIEDNSAGNKAKVSFTVAGSTATMLTPNTTTVVSSGAPISISWSIDKVTSCVAGGDWVSGSISRNSTDGNHIWPAPISFANTTVAPIEKKFLLTCQGDESGTGAVGPILREVKVTILPGGNVATVIVSANPKSVPDANGQFLTNLTWTTQNIIPGSCKGYATLNGTELVIPNWSSYAVPMSSQVPLSNPGVFGGPNGLVSNVQVAGSTNTDATTYGLVCQKVSGAVSAAPCLGMNNWVCGSDTVTIKEPIPLFLTAHTLNNPNSVPITTVANPGDKVTLKWRSIRDMECSVTSPWLTLGATSTPSTNWFGPKTDLDATNSRTAFENGIDVPSPTIYNITCRDKQSFQIYTASTTVAPAGMNTLQLSLIGSDEDSGFGADGFSNTVEQGGTVQIDIKKLAGDFVSGSCVATTKDQFSNPINSNWTGTGTFSNPTLYDPDKSVSGRTTGASTPVGTVITYEIGCVDTLSGIMQYASDQITVVQKPASLINLELDSSPTCIIPGQNFDLTVSSLSTVGTTNINFDSCTTTGPGPNAWENFGGGNLNSLNVGGGTIITIPYSSHNTPPGFISYSITCTDPDGDSVTAFAGVNVANQCINPPEPPGGGGNIKPIIEEQ